MSAFSERLEAWEMGCLRCQDCGDVHEGVKTYIDVPVGDRDMDLDLCDSCAKDRGLLQQSEVLLSVQEQEQLDEQTECEIELNLIRERGISLYD